MRTGSALIVKQHFEATKPLHKRTEATQPIHLCETAHLLRSCFEFLQKVLLQNLNIRKHPM